MVGLVVGAVRAGTAIAERTGAATGRRKVVVVVVVSRHGRTYELRRGFSFLFFCFWLRGLEGKVGNKSESEY